MRLAGHVHEQARKDEQAGHLHSAGRKLMRAANYYFAAERQTHPKDPRKTMLYKTMLQCFQQGASWRREPIEWVEIPYGDKTMPALFVPSGLPGPSPCMIHFDGLDVNKETIYLTGIAHEARRRGVAMLIVDHPGVGEALRLRGMHGTHQKQARPSTSHPSHAFHCVSFHHRSLGTNNSAFNCFRSAAPHSCKEIGRAHV
mgnify:CR=1 FL=1